MSSTLEESLEFLELCRHELNKNLEKSNKSTIFNTTTNENARFTTGIDILTMKPNIKPAQWYINLSDSIDEEDSETSVANSRVNMNNKQVTFDGLLSRMNRLEQELSEAEASYIGEDENTGQDDKALTMTQHNSSTNTLNSSHNGFNNTIHSSQSSSSSYTNQYQPVEEPVITEHLITEDELYASFDLDELNGELCDIEQEEEEEGEEGDTVGEMSGFKPRLRGNNQRSLSEDVMGESGEQDGMLYAAKLKPRTSISVDGIAHKEDKHHLRRNGLNLLNDSDTLDLLQQKGKQLKKSSNSSIRTAQSLESLKSEKQKGKFINRILRKPRVPGFNEEDEEDYGPSSIVSMPGGRMVSRTIGMYVDDNHDLIRTVEIHRRPHQSLGFFIRFGNGLDREDGIFVSRVTLGSIVDENNLLLSGDEIIKVNGTDVVNSSLENVVAMMQAADLLNIETRSQSALPFDAPDDNHSRTYSAPSQSFRPTKIRSRTVPLDQVSENEELITMAGEAKVLSEEEGSSSDSDEIFTSQEITNYQSDSYSTNLDFFQSFTGKLVVDISNVCGLCTTETNPCYCSIEINKEYKAKTQPRHPSPFMKFDDKFDLDVQQAKSLSIRIFHEQTIFSDKCSASGYIVLEKLLGHERFKQCVLNFPKSNIQVSLNIKFTEARNYLMRRQSTKPTGVFGFNLSQTLVTEKNTIPILVRKCVAEIEERGLTQEGIYRISGNARKKKELRKQFEENSVKTDVSDPTIDCHVITGILKDYLRELPKPLISQSMYKKIREGQQVNADNAAQRKMLASIMKMAPPVNRATLIFVIEHLRRVNENIEVNKMGFKNLAVCFGPVLMSPPIEEMKDIQKYVDALEFLLTIWPSETKQNML